MDRFGHIGNQQSGLAGHITERMVSPSGELMRLAARGDRMVHSFGQSGHALMVVDGERRILAHFFGVPAADLAMRLNELRATHGTEAQILLDGEVVTEIAVVRADPVDIPSPASDQPRQSEIATSELAHHMMWTSFERSAQVQAWMLEQANRFTRDLLDNNRRIADQASELQERFQANLAKIDAVLFEHKMMEEEAATRRMSRHILLQTRAEIEAEKPSDTGWLRDAVQVALLWTTQVRRDG